VALDLADQPRVIFDRNPLQNVIAQLRFPTIFALEQPAGVAGFQERIRDDYPKAEGRSQQLSVVVSPGGISAPTTQPGPWRFLSKDGSWVAALAPDFVSLETTNYQRFEGFVDRARRLFEVAGETLGLSVRGRLGLRYINQLRHPDARTVDDWRKYLENDLLGAVGGELLREHVVQAFQQIVLSLDAGGMTIRHGFVREDEEQSSYLLDLDAYDDREASFSSDEVIEKLTMFKRWTWNAFRRSITDEMATYLGPKELDATDASSS
jgi:uncharacterized protein (TIGR04255 family)